MYMDEQTDKLTWRTSLSLFPDLRRSLKPRYKIIYIYITPLFLIYYVFNRLVNRNPQYFQCFWYYTFFLQNWGDYTDISQAVLVYVTYASDVLLICWFGTQLTQHVRKNGLLLVLLTLWHSVHIMCMEPLINWEIMAQLEYWVFVCPTKSYALNFPLQNIKNAFLIIR
jgi:hypothetical protein